MASDNTGVRVWKVNPETKAGVMIAEREVTIAGDRSNFIAVSDKGVSIVGTSISFVVPSENQRHGGLFTKQNDFVQMFPSTMVTLMTTSQLPFPPMAFVSGILKDVPFFSALASAVA